MFEDLREGHWSRVWWGEGVSVGKGQSLRAVEAPGGFKQGIGVIRGVCYKDDFDSSVEDRSGGGKGGCGKNS